MRDFGGFLECDEETIHETQRLLLSWRPAIKWLEKFGMTRGEAAIFLLLESTNYRIGQVRAAIEEMVYGEGEAEGPESG